MEIEDTKMNPIIFKSTPNNWIKEARDIKRNTVRFFEKGTDDLREEILEDFIHKPFDLKLQITNTDTFDVSVKDVIDVSVLKSPLLDRAYIISW